jgi:ABC-type uncharacterized transport system fused permease/ATPase subunit
MSPLLLYLTRQLSIDWRRKLSEHMFSLYFKVQGFYATNSLFPDISHPDQRLVDDLQRVSLCFHRCISSRLGLLQQCAHII